jgi:hypothetical protein
MAGCDGTASNSSASDSTSSTAGVSSGTGASTPASAGAVTLSWVAPTENTDGTALTNLAGFDIHYGTDPNALSQEISISTVGMLTYVIDNLSSGTWYFEVIAVNDSGVESGPSSTVSATI